MESFHGLVIGERKKAGGVPHSIYYSGSEEPKDSLKGGVNSFVSELSNKTLFNHAVGKDAEYIMVGGHDFGVRRKASRDRMVEENLLGHMRAYLSRDLSTPEAIHETLLDLHNKIESGMHLYDAGNLVSALLYKRAMQKGYGAEFVPIAQKALAAGALLAKDVDALNQGRAGEGREKFIKEAIQRVSAGGNAGEVAELMGLSSAGLKALGFAAPALKVEPAVRAEPAVTVRPTPPKREPVKQPEKRVPEVAPEPEKAKPAPRALPSRAGPSAPPSAPPKKARERVQKETVFPETPEQIGLPGEVLEGRQAALFPTGGRVTLAKEVKAAKAESHYQLTFKDLPRDWPPAVKVGLKFEGLGENALFNKLLGADPQDLLKKLTERVWMAGSTVQEGAINVGSLKPELKHLTAEDFHEFYSSKEGEEYVRSLLGNLHNRYSLGLLSDGEVRQQITPYLMKAVGGNQLMVPKEKYYEVFLSAVKNWPLVREYLEGDRKTAGKELRTVFKGLGVSEKHFGLAGAADLVYNKITDNGRTPEVRNRINELANDFSKGNDLAAVIRRSFGLSSGRHSWLLPLQEEYLPGLKTAKKTVQGEPVKGNEKRGKKPGFLGKLFGPPQ